MFLIEPARAIQSCEVNAEPAGRATATRRRLAGPTEPEIGRLSFRLHARGAPARVAAGHRVIPKARARGASPITCELCARNSIDWAGGASGREMILGHPGSSQIIGQAGRVTGATMHNCQPPTPPPSHLISSVALSKPGPCAFREASPLTRRVTIAPTTTIMMAFMMVID